jgi:hypothetical protein
LQLPSCGPSAGRITQHPALPNAFACDLLNAPTESLKPPWLRGSYQPLWLLSRYHKTWATPPTSARRFTLAPHAPRHALKRRAIHDRMEVTYCCPSWLAEP